jgi:hypothetical protein
MSERERSASSPFVLKLPMKASVLGTTAVILAGLVLLYIETFNMTPSNLPGYPGDAFYPRAVLAFCIIWAVIILARGIFLPLEAAAVHQEAPTLSVHWPEFVSVILLVLLYAWLVEPVGFEITTTALMMVLLVPRLLAAPDARLAPALLQGFALSAAAMLILYVGLGPSLKIGLPLRFLPIYIL